MVDHFQLCAVPSDGSLDSAGWPEGGDWLGSEPQRDQVDKKTTELPFLRNRISESIIRWVSDQIRMDPH